DVAGAQRSQESIGQGVETDIGIRMPFEAGLVRNLDAAQPDAVTRGEAVDIEPGAGARLASGVGTATLDQLPRHRDVLSRRQLDVALAAGDENHLVSGPLGDGRVVGERDADLSGRS